MASFNGERFLGEMLDSLDAQMSATLQIHVFDDNSTDRSVEILSARPSVELHKLAQPVRCAGANFLRAFASLDISNSTYVAFADQDDIWRPSKLKRAAAMLKLSRADCYSSNVVATWDNPRRALCIDKAQPQVAFDHYFEAAGPGCTYVFTKQAALRLQGLVRANLKDVTDGRIHDWFLYQAARTLGLRWHIDRQWGLLYRQHENNVQGVSLGWKSKIFRLKKLFSGAFIKEAEDNCRVLGDPFFENLSLPFVFRNIFQFRRKRVESVVIAFVLAGWCIKRLVRA